MGSETRSVEEVIRHLTSHLIGWRVKGGNPNLSFAPILRRDVSLDHNPLIPFTLLFHTFSYPFLSNQENGAAQYTKMATTIDLNSTPKPTPLSIPYSSPQQHHQQQQSSPSSDQQPPSPTNTTQAIYAPLPTRRMLSQLLRQWQQSLAPQSQPITPVKESPTHPVTTVQEASPKQEVPTPQTSRTPSRLMVSSPQYTTTPTSTSPHLALTTPTHARRASVTTFLPAESLLMSPIPRARNPGGFRPTSSGSITMGLDDENEGISPFGEVVGLVGGWEEKMRSATAWAVVNTTTPNTAAIPVQEEEEGMVLEEGRRSKNVDVSV